MSSDTTDEVVIVRGHRVVVVPVVLVLVLAVSGCSSGLPDRSPGTAGSPSVPTSSPTTVAQAKARATRMVEAAVLPTTATRLTSRPASLPASDGGPACHPIESATRYWRVAGLSMAQVSRFLAAHVPAGLEPAGTGHGGVGSRTTSMSVSDAIPFTGIQFARMDFVVIDSGGGAVDVRLDSRVIPPGADCGVSREVPVSGG